MQLFSHSKINKGLSLDEEEPEVLKKRKISNDESINTLDIEHQIKTKDSVTQKECSSF